MIEDGEQKLLEARIMIRVCVPAIGEVSHDGRHVLEDAAALDRELLRKSKGQRKNAVRRAVSVAPDVDDAL